MLSTDQVYLPYVLLRSFGDHFFGLLINANILVLDMDCLNEIIPYDCIEFENRYYD